MFRFKNPDIRPQDLVGSFGIEYVDILSEDKTQNAYVCFAKTRWPKDLSIFFRDSDIILCVPLVIADEKIHIAFMTDFDKMDKVWDQLQSVGNQFKVLSINTNPSSPEHLFFLLTDRQREIIFYALRNGYYEIPRKITTSQLAEKFSISQSALSEHLRKIERIIFHSAFNL